ncbi:MAG: von Willebrand factor type A domain-containing protein [bacterium]|nr:von Willebrand factor type A domain-containing protein [bacterium]
MKRYLKHDRYRLDEHEAGSLWYAVRRELKDKEGGGAHRPAARAWRPALATVSVVAIAVVTVSWWLAGRGPSQAEHAALSGGSTTVAALEAPEAPVRARRAEPAAPAAASSESREVETAANRTDSGPAVAAEPRLVVEQKTAVAADRSGVITGRVVDQSDGTPVAFANVMLVGTTRGTSTDSAGVFRFEQMEPGRRHELQVVMLGYAPLDVAVDLPGDGRADVACGLEPVVVAALQPFDVTGEEYMVEIKSAVSEHKVTGETFEKYAIDSVEDALSKQAGVVYRAGEKYVRGGRSGEVSMQIDGSPTLPAPAGESRTAAGSVTGGTTPPNGEKFELMYFEHAGVNPFVATDDDALSTFALDVDNASFSLARSYLDRGELPPADAIRVEEFVNALDAGWQRHGSETFRIGLDGGPSRFGEGYHLLRVGIVGRSVEDGRRKPANLVFVIDVSGSMDRESRLGSVKRALRTLVDELGEGDRVGIVVYGSRGDVLLPLTDVSQRSTILGVIDGLQPNGSTNAVEGLTLAYDLARRSYDAGIINRLVLCSDGVANTGTATSAEGILALARRGSDDGITLSTVGFGMGNYNDVLMEKLADQGDGNYFYVDGPREAERVFRENLTGMLQTIATQAKVQVEFDPRRVSRWRLLGYENRDVADRDFRNDAVDAGEVGVGHQVTALYELKLVGEGRSDDAEDARLGTVHLRWEAPEHDTSHAGKVTEIERDITRGMFVKSEPDGSPHRRAQALAAEFAEILRGSYWAKESRLSSLVPVADGLARELPRDQAVQDLARMVRRAADIKEGEGAHHRQPLRDE